MAGRSQGCWTPNTRGALAAALMSSDSLPDPLTEALVAIDEMATPEGQERLEFALAGSDVAISLAPDSSRGEIALQVWLAAPEFLARRHNEQRMLRLARFEYFGPHVPAPEQPPVPSPSGEALKALAVGLDGWFHRHHRGQETARIECHSLQQELWFMVRHGDTFTRTPAVDRHRTQIIHYRPERDNLVVYSPTHGEIRVHARTRGERELYRWKWLRTTGTTVTRSTAERTCLAHLSGPGDPPRRPAQARGVRV